MKTERKVLFPFSSGRCRSCHKFAKSKTQRLCQKCLRFVDQDYGYLREQLGLMEAISGDVDASTIQQKGSGGVSERRAKASEKRLCELMKKSGFSYRQKQIAFLIFVERKTFFEISKKLGISKASVQRHFDRAREKARFCHTGGLLVRGTTSPNLRSVPFAYRLRDEYRSRRETLAMVGDLVREAVSNHESANEGGAEFGDDVLKTKNKEEENHEEHKEE
jgi:DNA-binding MarR family transcriptional regulator